MQAQRKTLWLASQPVSGLGVADVVPLIEGYEKQLLHAQPRDGEAASYKAIVVVLTDLPADRAKGFFEDVLGRIATESPPSGLSPRSCDACRGARGGDQCAAVTRRTAW